MSKTSSRPLCGEAYADDDETLAGTVLPIQLFAILTVSSRYPPPPSGNTVWSPSIQVTNPSDPRRRDHEAVVQRLRAHGIQRHGQHAAERIHHDHLRRRHRHHGPARRIQRQRSRTHRPRPRHDGSCLLRHLILGKALGKGLACGEKEKSFGRRRLGASWA